MGFMDGAVNGMVSRLMSAGFSPEESFSIGQAAYIEPGKRVAGALQPVLAPQQIALEVSQTLALLGPFPMGPEAHRQRIMLWEKIFGLGTWPEPISQNEIYGPDTSVEDQLSALLSGALRYFDRTHSAFEGDRPMLPSIMVAMNGSEQRSWEGFLLAFDGMIGFFEEKDCVAADTDDGDPVVHYLASLNSCAVRLPQSIHRPQGVERVEFLEPVPDFWATFSFDDDTAPLTITVPFKELREDQKEETAKSLQRLIQLASKAIRLRPHTQESPQPSARDTTPVPAYLPQKPGVAPAQTASPYATEFNPYRHDTVRYPPAPGFTERQLDERFLETVHPAAVPAVVGGIGLFLAVLAMPYEFYVILRWLVSVMAIWVSIVAGRQKKTGWVVVSSLIAILWNPIIPIELPRSAWVIPDVIGAVLFATAGINLKASKPALRSN